MPMQQHRFHMLARQFKVLNTDVTVLTRIVVQIVPIQFYFKVQLWQKALHQHGVFLFFAYSFNMATSSSLKY